MPKTAPEHKSYHPQSFSVRKEQVQWEPFPWWVPSPTVSGSFTHSWNLVDCFLSTVIYFQQIFGKLKFPNSVKNYPVYVLTC